MNKSVTFGRNPQWLRVRETDSGVTPPKWTGEPRIKLSPMTILERLALALIIATLFATSPVVAGPVTIGIMPAENLSHDKATAHCRYALPFLLMAQLRQVKAIHSLSDDWLEFGPDTVLAYGCRQVDPSGGWNDKLVRKVGQAVEAAKMIREEYQRDGSAWRLTAEVIDISSGKVSKPLTATSPDWFQAICRLRKLLVRELNLTPTSEEEKSMDRPWTSSPAALEAFSRALAAITHGEPVAAIRKDLLDAAAADPKFVMVWQALAMLSLEERKTDEAKRYLERASELAPDSVITHYLLGKACEIQDLHSTARHEWREALRLSPNEPLILVLLAEQDSQEESLRGQALESLLKAQQIAPYEASVHLELARIYIANGNVKQARAQLQLGEQLNMGTDTGTIAELHELLHDTAKAARLFEQFIAGAERLGIHSAVVDDAKAELADLKARLTPAFVSATHPSALTQQEFATKVQSLLPTNTPCALTNPFALTPAMVTWAQQLTVGATGELAVAKALFVGLSRPAGPTEHSGQLTAQEAFAAWHDPRANLLCQDYTFLYVALARSLGLKAYYVLVEQDYQNRLVAHSCAGVCIGQKALLVDLSYSWFGAPHKRYEFLSDSEAIGLYLTSSDVPAEQQLSLKLSPNRALPRFFLAIDLAQDDRPDEAKKYLTEGLRLDSTNWWALAAQGAVEVSGKHADLAVKHLRECLALDPQWPELHYLLAQAYEQSGQPIKARDEYRAFVAAGDDPKTTERARERITCLNTELH